MNWKWAEGRVGLQDDVHRVLGVDGAVALAQRGLDRPLARVEALIGQV